MEAPHGGKEKGQKESQEKEAGICGGKEEDSEEKSPEKGQEKEPQSTLKDKAIAPKTSGTS